MAYNKDDKDTIGQVQFSDMLSADSEFVPIFPGDLDEGKLFKDEIPESLSILPLRNTVLFPGVIIPITVGRESSIELIKKANTGDKVIGVVAQCKAEVEDPGFEDIYHIGTLARILKVLNMPDGNTMVILQGRRPIEVKSIIEKTPFLVGEVVPYGTVKPVPKTREFVALITSIRDISQQIAKNAPKWMGEISFAINNIEDPYLFSCFIASHVDIPVEMKQELLEKKDLIDLSQSVLAQLTKELQMANLQHDIQNKVKIELDKQQRDYMLHQQIRTIQEELGDNSTGAVGEDLFERAQNKNWPDNVAETFEKELQKLQRMNSSAADYSIQVNYLETLVDLPWYDCTKDKLDFKRAQRILDRDHFGLEDIKKRIVEFLAVLKLRSDMKSPILCLVGPPGVGKTSLGKSLADAIGRKYIRMSLGGLRDESEIRGHRKTYIGAMPGRVIQSLKKAKASNPVFVLDEIDKVIGANMSGDPSAALLELLDPEQNSAFYDNFIETEYDLSKVMFVATANTTQTIHPALLDRMEIIDISGYIIEEKLEIAKRHLIPKQLKEHGVEKSQLQFPKATISYIVENYTREAGVRKLEKQIAKLIRSNAKFIASDEEYVKKITPKEVLQFLGAPMVEKEVNENNNIAGVVTGLAWTAVGGVILTIESTLSKGKGKYTQTGMLGDVMKESSTIAFEFLKANAERLGIDPELFEKWNIHLHIPEGATPKDGPSAGVTMLTSLTSLLTQRKVKKGIAMTGEITLRGKILPVGGVKEKILAAKRAGVKTVVLPLINKKDVLEIKPHYLKGLNVEYMSDMMELLTYAITDQKVDNWKKLQ